MTTLSPPFPFPSHLPLSFRPDTLRFDRCAMQQISSARGELSRVFTRRDENLGDFAARTWEMLMPRDQIALESKISVSGRNVPARPRRQNVGLDSDLDATNSVSTGLAKRRPRRFGLIAMLTFDRSAVQRSSAAACLSIDLP